MVKQAINTTLDHFLTGEALTVDLPHSSLIDTFLN